MLTSSVNNWALMWLEGGRVKAANTPPFRSGPGHGWLLVPTLSLQPSFQPGSGEAALPQPLQNALSSKEFHKLVSLALPGSPHLDVASATSALQSSRAPTLSIPERCSPGVPQMRDPVQSEGFFHLLPLHFTGRLGASGQQTTSLSPLRRGK